MFLFWRWKLAEWLCPELVRHYESEAAEYKTELACYQDFVEGVYQLQQKYPVGDLATELNPLFTELDLSEAGYSPA